MHYAMAQQDKAIFNGGEAAIPFGITDDIVKNGIHSFGLTKREYFAGFAMQAILSNPSFYGPSAQEIASDAVEYADALLLQLETPQQ